MLLLVRDTRFNHVNYLGRLVPSNFYRPRRTLTTRVQRQRFKLIARYVV